MSHIFIKDLEVGQHLDGYYLITGGMNGETRHGKPFTFVEISDITGKLTVKIWNSDEEIQSLVDENVGNYLQVTGEVTEYSGNKEISPDSMMLVFIDDIEDYPIDLDNYVKQPKIPLDVMKKEIIETIKDIEHPEISEILKVAMNRYFAEFVESPGAKSMHHNYDKGLLTHTYTMLKIAKSLVEVYGEEYLDTDVLYGGLILHDIGKIKEYEMEKGKIDVTLRGLLMGHISLGHEIIVEICQERGFDINDESNLKLQSLIHLVLSHHGKREWGSPVTPQTAEAHILHQIDMIDSRMDVIKSTLDNMTVGEISKPIFMLDNGRLVRHL